MKSFLQFIGPVHLTCKNNEKRVILLQYMFLVSKHYHVRSNTSSSPRPIIFKVKTKLKRSRLKLRSMLRFKLGKARSFISHQHVSDILVSKSKFKKRFLDLAGKDSNDDTGMYIFIFNMVEFSFILILTKIEIKTYYQFCYQIKMSILVC